jgi:hypothetical protein
VHVAPEDLDLSGACGLPANRPNSVSRHSSLFGRRGLLVAGPRVSLSQARGIAVCLASAHLGPPGHGSGTGAALLCRAGHPRVTSDRGRIRPDSSDEGPLGPLANPRVTPEMGPLVRADQHAVF